MKGLIVLFFVGAEVMQNFVDVFVFQKSSSTRMPFSLSDCLLLFLSVFNTAAVVTVVLYNTLVACSESIPGNSDSRAPGIPDKFLFPISWNFSD